MFYFLSVNFATLLSLILPITGLSGKIVVSISSKFVVASKVIVLVEFSSSVLFEIISFNNFAKLASFSSFGFSST